MTKNDRIARNIISFYIFTISFFNVYIHFLAIIIKQICSIVKILFNFNYKQFILKKNLIRIIPAAKKISKEK